MITLDGQTTSERSRFELFNKSRRYRAALGLVSIALLTACGSVSSPEPPAATYPVANVDETPSDAGDDPPDHLDLPPTFVPATPEQLPSPVVIDMSSVEGPPKNPTREYFSAFEGFDKLSPVSQSFFLNSKEAAAFLLGDPSSVAIEIIPELVGEEPFDHQIYIVGEFPVDLTYNKGDRGVPTEDGYFIFSNIAIDSDGNSVQLKFFTLEMYSDGKLTGKYIPGSTQVEWVSFDGKEKYFFDEISGQFLSAERIAYLTDLRAAQLVASDATRIEKTEAGDGCAYNEKDEVVATFDLLSNSWIETSSETSGALFGPEQPVDSKIEGVEEYPTTVIIQNFETGWSTTSMQEFLGVFPEAKIPTPDEFFEMTSSIINGYLPATALEAPIGFNNVVNGIGGVFPLGEFSITKQEATISGVVVGTYVRTNTGDLALFVFQLVTDRQGDVFSAVPKVQLGKIGPNGSIENFFITSTDHASKAALLSGMPAFFLGLNLQDPINEVTREAYESYMAQTGPSGGYDLNSVSTWNQATTGLNVQVILLPPDYNQP